MPKTLSAGIVALALIATTPASFAQPPTAAAPAPAAPMGKLSSQSSIKALAADAKAREALVTHIPELAEFLISGQADGLIPDTTTLDELAQMPEAQQTGLTADALKKINEALAR